jgi:hypothetical protein
MECPEKFDTPLVRHRCLLLLGGSLESRVKKKTAGIAPAVEERNLILPHELEVMQ